LRLFVRINIQQSILAIVPVSYREWRNFLFAENAAKDGSKSDDFIP
jgi:hypothetical protein